MRGSDGRRAAGASGSYLYYSGIVARPPKLYIIFFILARVYTNVLTAYNGHTGLIYVRRMLVLLFDA